MEIVFSSWILRSPQTTRRSGAQDGSVQRILSQNRGTNASSRLKALFSKLGVLKIYTPTSDPWGSLCIRWQGPSLEGDKCQWEGSLGDSPDMLTRFASWSSTSLICWLYTSPICDLPIRRLTFFRMSFLFTCEAKWDLNEGSALLATDIDMSWHRHRHDIEGNVRASFVPCETILSLPHWIWEKTFNCSANRPGRKTLAVSGWLR